MTARGKAMPGFGACVIALTLYGTAAAQLETAPDREDPLRRYRAARDGPDLDAWVARLRDPRPEIRLAAVKSMADSGDREAVPHLIEAATDSDPRVASRAIDSLGRLRATEATDFLAQRLFLKGISDPLRHQILAALGRIGDTGASRSVLQFVEQTEDPDLRGAAIYALGEIGDSTVQPAVERIVERETDPALKRLAGEALDKISGRRFEPTPLPPGTSNPLLQPLEQP